MKKFDKRVKWIIIIGLIISLLIPPGVLIGIYMVNPQNLEDNSMVDFTRVLSFTPTPNSDINVHYSILENQTGEQFLYQFNFTFDILKGIESTYTDEVNGWVFNQTQLYISIKGNYDLEFYAIFFILNSSEFQVDDSQISIIRDLNITQRFENLSIKLRICRTTNGEEGPTHFLGGSLILFEKKKKIIVDDFSSFSGNMRIWIDENHYVFNYTAFQNHTLQYTLNSSIGSLELLFAYLTIRTINDTSYTETERIDLPFSPLQSSGNHTENSSINLTSDFIGLEFEINVAVEHLGIYIEYEFELLSDILAEQEVGEKARRDKLRNSLFTYSLFVTIGIAVVLGCMVNYKRE